MPTFQIERHHERRRIVAGVFAAGTFNTSDCRRPVTIPTIENLALIQPDRIVDAMGLDVGDELVELGALDQREDVRERMKLDAAHARTRRMSWCVAANLTDSAKRRDGKLGPSTSIV